MIIDWHNDLGAPTEAGTVEIQGLGRVEVSQEEIEQAQEFDAPLKVEVVEDTSFVSQGRTFVLGSFVTS